MTTGKEVCDLRNKSNKGIERIIIVLFLIAGAFITYLTPGNALAQTEHDNLALQAIRAQYDSYQNGAPVNGGGYTDFCAYDAYILETAGADTSTWMYDSTSLKDRVLTLIDTTITNADETTTDWTGNVVYANPAKKIAQNYLAAKIWGESEKADQLLNILRNRQTENCFDNNTFSDIPVFELLGRAGDIDAIDATNAINYILAQQDAGTGAWDNSWNDFQLTAQAIRALYYLKDQPGIGSEVQTTAQTAIDNGINWMKTLQKDDGSFQDAGGFDYKITDTAEVIYTLKLLGIDPSSWTKAGKSPVDYMNTCAVTDGSFGNIGCTTSALDAYLQLGGRVAADAILGVKVDPAQINIKVNENHQFTASAYMFNGATEDVSSTTTWSTEKPEIAAIDSSGRLTGIATGSTAVTAVYNNVTGKAIVNVSKTGGSVPSDSITVSIAVVGKAGNLLYRPGSVQISEKDEFGLTAMSALAATGLSYKFSNRNDGMVVSIAGEANEGMNGWCGKVNNSSFWDVPREIPVTEGDKIIFWYSIDANFDGPEWKDLLLGNIVPTTTSKEQLKETILSYQDELNDLLKVIGSQTAASELKVLNADNKMEAPQTLQQELDNNRVVISEAVDRSEAVLGDTEVSMLVPENALAQTTILSIKELAADQEQPANIRLRSSIYEFGPDGTRFDQPVTITLKVPVTDDLDIEQLRPAWYDRKSQQWIPIPAVIDLKTGLVVFQIDHFTQFALIELPETIIKETRVTFADVNEDMAWAQDAIETMAGKGIIKGTGPELFEPQRPISRAEFVTLATAALNLKTEDYRDGLFNDVNASDWFAASVATAYHNGIIAGYPDGSFQPDHSISRNEIASIFYRIEGGTGNTDDIELTYQDLSDIPAWTMDGVRFAYKQGLMSGYENGTFRGQNQLTRAEAAVVIYKYLNLAARI